MKNNLRVTLSRRNRTQSQLAQHLGVQRTTVCNWVNGARVPNLTAALAMSGFLKTPVNKLFTLSKGKRRA